MAAGAASTMHCAFFADHLAEKQVDACRDQDSDNRAEELTGGQAKEDTLLVLPDFFRDFYLYKMHLISFENLTFLLD